MYPGSPALGKFYISTDGATHTFKEGYCEFWPEVDKTVIDMGFPSLCSKFHLPVCLMMFLGWCCEIVGSIIGKKLKLSRFTVKMLTMHRWFNIEPTHRDLKYEPLIGFKDCDVGCPCTGQCLQRRSIDTRTVARRYPCRDDQLTPEPLPGGGFSTCPGSCL